MKYTSVKGMTDITPGEIGLWQRLEAAARETFGRYGYSEIRTPIVEKTSLFVRGIGDSTAVVEKEMYSFDDASGDSLSLRPEGTASVVRAYIQSGAYKISPEVKYLSIGPMFRRERPQKGRYRQFHQTNIEAIGFSDPTIDAEQISMCESYFRNLGLKDFQIEINSLGCKECRPKYNKVFKAFLEKKGSKLCDDCNRRIQKNPLRAFDCKNEDCISVIKDAPLIGEYLCGGCVDHFAGVKKSLGLLGVKYIENQRIVRGLDYYMRTTFEFTTDKLGTQNAIAAGGRYDGLVKDLGGPDVPGVGFAIGMERVILLLQALNLDGSEKKDLVFFAMLGSVARDKFLPIINTLRKDGIAVELDYEDKSLKSQMRRADRLGAHSVVIVGDAELGKNIAVVRNMHSKEQEEVKIEDLPRHFVRVEE